MDRIKVKSRNTIVIARNPVERILMKLKDFIIRKRTVISYSLIIALGLVVLGTAAFIFFDRRSHNLLIRYESIMSEYDTKDAGKRADIIEKLNNLREKAVFGSVYQKATWSAGNLYFEEGKFEEAGNALIEFSDKSSYEIYSVLASLKAGCAAEEEGNLDKALAIYKKLEEKHGRGVCADSIFYNLGRAYSLKGDFSQSGKYYNILLADYPNSVFAQSAKKRLFFIKDK
ncbi:MAG: tetratricopeptide repeat protein [Leptospirales bacterium]|nr:tetratricopeptide repeat protein [Leptospirales bacterium]